MKLILATAAGIIPPSLAWPAGARMEHTNDCKCPLMSWRMVY